MAARRQRRKRDPEPEEAALPVTRHWIWWRSQPGARPKAREELESLPTKPQADLAAKIDRYRKGESRAHDVDHLGDGIYEIRHRQGNNHYRVLFFMWGPHWVALTAFYKNQQKTPATDKNRAHKRMTQWCQTFGDQPPPDQ
ncbi:toxin [Amycolatopsis sp. NBRC 101858]|uniref:type II toxin-antitoxin system RelE/ParE family toxin n=1 Tax=Amycolatopsis sp. NBRC 101858 TaxID=3032200 RepID=UPI0024A0E24D|nr:toxin [Amycolatopsis sp. NBRC 101858]